MSVDAGKVRAAVESTLKETRTLTEREVKAAVARLLKTKPGAIAATVIRDVRKAMGIDRPAAIAFARQLIRKDPTAPAKSVIEAVAARYGVRIGAPDVSRMRPEKSKRATGRRASAGRPRRGAEKPVKAVKAAKPAKAAKSEEAAKVSAPAAEASPAPAKVRKVRGNGRRRGRGKARGKRAPAAPDAAEAGPVLKVVKAAAARAKAVPAAKGAVTVTFEGTGHPDDLAEFFLSLARKS